MSVLPLLDPHLPVPDDSNPRTEPDVEDLAAAGRNVGSLQTSLVVPSRPPTHSTASDTTLPQFLMAALEGIL